MSVYTGTCLCGKIEVSVSGGISSIIHCHCSKCRKSSGTAFATNGFVSSSGFSILRGAEELRSYEPSPGRARHFCGTCGSPIFSSSKADPSRIRIRLGILDSEIIERPISHNFITSAASWEDLDADLPRYEAYEPGRR